MARAAIEGEHFECRAAAVVIEAEHGQQGLRGGDARQVQGFEQAVRERPGLGDVAILAEADQE